MAYSNEAKVRAFRGTPVKCAFNVLIGKIIVFQDPTSGISRCRLFSIRFDIISSFFYTIISSGREKEDEQRSSSRPARWRRAGPVPLNVRRRSDNGKNMREHTRALTTRGIILLWRLVIMYQPDRFIAYVWHYRFSHVAECSRVEPCGKYAALKLNSVRAGR